MVVVRDRDRSGRSLNPARTGASGRYLVLAGCGAHEDDAESIFYRLGELAAGDVIEITSEDGAVSRYQVAAVEQVDTATADSTALIDPSPNGGADLRFITCCGEWDAASGDFPSRTIVHANRID